MVNPVKKMPTPINRPLYLVHNGIIENYQELRSHLKDHRFISDTDTEVLVALISSFYDDGKYPLVNAVVQALELVKGTYGIAVVSEKNPDEIVAARLGSPIVIGVGSGETFLASDASALVGHTEKAIYLNDGEVARLTKDDCEIRALGSQPVSAKVEAIETDISAIQKGGYDHFLLKEIMEQPASLAETLRGRIDPKNHTVHLGGPGLSQKELSDIKHLIIVGCGTAYYAACLAAYYIERFTNDITIESVVASEYRYRDVCVPDCSVALIVSQSAKPPTLSPASVLLKPVALGLSVSSTQSVAQLLVRPTEAPIFMLVQRSPLPLRKPSCPKPPLLLCSVLLSPKLRA